MLPKFSPVLPDAKGCTACGAPRADNTGCHLRPFPGCVCCCRMCGHTMKLLSPTLFVDLTPAEARSLAEHSSFVRYRERVEELINHLWG